VLKIVNYWKQNKLKLQNPSQEIGDGVNFREKEGNVLEIK
jgi:hypothetical protein